MYMSAIGPRSNGLYMGPKSNYIVGRNNGLMDLVERTRHPERVRWPIRRGKPTANIYRWLTVHCSPRWTASSKRRLYESGDLSEAMSFERSGSDN